MRSSSDRGSASILMMGMLAVSFSWVLALATVEKNLSGSMTAQTAADATALAAVRGGLVAARQTALLNRATIVALTVDDAIDGVGQTAVVMVEVDNIVATATASDQT